MKTSLAAVPAATQGHTRHRRRGLVPRIVDLLLSTNPRLRSRVALSLGVSMLYIIWSATELYCAHAGLLPTQPVYIICALNLIGAIAFWPLIRSGWTLRFQDPGIVIAQMIWATFSIILGYALLPLLRGPIPELLCLIQVYAMLNLTPKQSSRMAAWTVAMLVMMVVVMSLWGPAEFDPKAASTHMAIVIFVIIALAMNAMIFGDVQLRLQQQRVALKAAVDEVEKLVVRDPLTGLFNRQHMQEALEHEAQRFGVAGQPFCAVLIDLDHFKRVNDTHGHQAGDDVLCGFASMAQAVLRETDLVARWGGEEFLILLRETDLVDPAITGLNRLRDKLSQKALLTSVPDMRVTFSAGIARYRDGETCAQMLERADRALYRAKQNGRNRIELEEPA